jgi:hypothetical protein
VLLLPLSKFLQLTALRMSFSLQLQKEVLFESFSKLTLPLTSMFFLYLDSKGQVGVGFFWITHRLLWAKSRGSENVENPPSPR